MMKKQARSMLCGILLAATLLGGCGQSEHLEAEKKLRQEGIDYMTNGNYEKAAETFQLALDEAKNGIGDLEIDICLYRAEALFQAGQIDQAEAVYTALIEYCDYADAYYLRGNIDFSRGDTENGREDFAKAIAKDPSNGELYISVYQTMARYGMGEEAREYLQKVVDMKGDKPAAKLQKGRACMLLGDTENAISYLNDALKKGEPEANFRLAELYTSTGQSEEAQKYFTAYLESGKANAASLQVLGENCMNNGDYASAVTYFRAALEFEPAENYQQLLKDTVVAYEYTRDFKAAYALLQDYVKIYYDDDEAREELAFLSTR